MNTTADNPYLLLTPGPLTTSTAVKESMLRDWCTWDDEYKELVQDIRRQLVLLTGDLDTFTSVLMQGSGTFSVESVLTSAVPKDGKLLVVVNGAYGRRMAEIARVAEMETLVLDSGELDHPDLDDLDLLLQEDPKISHVAVVHCETTTGMLNPVEEIGRIVRPRRRLGVVLSREDRLAANHKGLDCAVVQVDLANLAILGQRVGQHGEAMILAGNPDLAGLDIEHRLVTAVVTELELEGLAAQGHPNADQVVVRIYGG